MYFLCKYLYIYISRPKVDLLVQNRLAGSKSAAGSGGGFSWGSGEGTLGAALLEVLACAGGRWNS